MDVINNLTLALVAPDVIGVVWMILLVIMAIRGCSSSEWPPIASLPIGIFASITLPLSLGIVEVVIGYDPKLPITVGAATFWWGLWAFSSISVIVVFAIANTRQRFRADRSASS